MRTQWKESLNTLIIKWYKDGKTTPWIGIKTGYSKATIVHRLHRLGIVLRRSQDYTRGKRIVGLKIGDGRIHEHIVDDELKQLYESGMGGDELADYFKVTRSCIYLRLRKIGMKMRDNTQLIGNKHWRWTGDYNIPLYKRNRGSRLSKEWSLKVKKRDDYTCQDCGVRGNVHAHHIRPFKDCYDTKDAFDVNNGKTLCHECHVKIHRILLSK